MQKYQSSYHAPVMLEECMEHLHISPSGVYVDVTFGGGGHSKAILDRLGPDGRLYAFDQDSDAQKNTINDARFTLIPVNYSTLKSALAMYGVGKVNGILADLGVSSHQLNEGNRGFSFREDAPLDMRMNAAFGISAADFLNTAEEIILHKVLSEYGEVRNSKTLAKKLVEYRSETPWKTTSQLANFCGALVAPAIRNKYLAQVFQALRIAVNEEMEHLDLFLHQVHETLAEDGTFVAMSYHSLEDRRIKRLMKAGNVEGIVEKDDKGVPTLYFENILKKPLMASKQEVAQNPRARSAKLRAARKR